MTSGGDAEDDDPFSLPKIAYFQRRRMRANQEQDWCSSVFHGDGDQWETSLRERFADEYARLEGDAEWRMAAALMAAARLYADAAPASVVVHVAARTGPRVVFAASASFGGARPPPLRVASARDGADSSAGPPLWLAGRRVALVAASLETDGAASVYSAGRLVAALVAAEPDRPLT